MALRNTLVLSTDAGLSATGPGPWVANPLPQGTTGFLQTYLSNTPTATGQIALEYTNDPTLPGALAWTSQNHTGPDTSDGQDTATQAAFMRVNVLLLPVGGSKFKAIFSW